MDRQTILDHALTFLDHGFSIIPCNADKKAAVPWAQYQKNPMTPEEAARHFFNGARLAVIGGKVSSNLECIDFDNPKLYPPFLELLAEQDPTLASSLVKMRTPRGYHLLYRCSGAVSGNQKIATAMIEVSGEGNHFCEWRPGKEYSSKQIDGKWFISPCAIETRGEGGYFVSAPSPGYEILENSLFDCPVLTPEQVGKLHTLALMFDERPQQAEQKNYAGKNDTASPGSEFNSIHSVSDILRRHGWLEGKRTTAGTGWTRPGKKSGVSGVLLDRTGNFYVWSSSASPLESGRSYDAFGLFVFFEYEGNFRTAARELYRAKEKPTATGQERPNEAACVTSLKSLRDGVLTADQFMEMQITEREYYLYPWLRDSSITIVSAPRGVGKSWFTTSGLLAVAGGGVFGPWKSLKSVPCLYLDGEMVASDIKERLLMLQAARGLPLHIYNDAYASTLGLPKSDMGNPEWRDKFKLLLLDLGIKLVAFDNIASLSPGIDENSKQEWDPINQWLLDLRFTGISSWLVHHMGKNFAQRGTSGREDNIDVSVSLLKPADYVPEHGCRFIAHFSKHRLPQKDIYLIADTEFKLVWDGGHFAWESGGVAKKAKNECFRLLINGLDQKSVAETVGVSKSTISKWRASFFNNGFITEKNVLTSVGSMFLKGENVDF